MSISGIPSNSNLYSTPVTNDRSQSRNDFSDLAKALNAGDLSAAQSAFSALQQILPSGSSSSTSSIGSQASGAPNALSTDIAALGSSLQSGDLSGAQDAFKKVQQDMKSAHHGHHHHRHGGGVQSSPSPVESTTNNGLASNDLSGNGQFGVTA